MLNAKHFKFLLGGQNDNIFKMACNKISKVDSPQLWVLQHT